MLISQEMLKMSYKDGEQEDCTLPIFQCQDVNILVIAVIRELLVVAEIKLKGGRYE
jgi:hypothetical protein